MKEDGSVVSAGRGDGHLPEILEDVDKVEAARLYSQLSRTFTYLMGWVRCSRNHFYIRRAIRIQGLRSMQHVGVKEDYFIEDVGG